MLWAKSEQGAIWGEAREGISHRHVAGKHLLQMEIFMDSRQAAEAQERKLHRQLLKVILAATRCRSQVKLSPLGGTALPVLRVLRCFWMILDAWEFSTSH